MQILSALIDAKLDLLLGLVKFGCLLLRLNLADNLFEELYRFGATLAFVSLDVHLNVAVGPNCDIEFPLNHDH